MRATTAGVLAVLIGVLAAFILGEYQMTGATPLAAGIILGLLIAEVFLAVGKRKGWDFAAIAALATAGALAGAGWINSGQGLIPYPAFALVGAALGAGVAAFRLRPT